MWNACACATRCMKTDMDRCHGASHSVGQHTCVLASHEICCHPHIMCLLEVIDDKLYQKVYMGKFIWHYDREQLDGAGDIDVTKQRYNWE